MSVLRRIVAWLPRDMSLSEEEFRRRHVLVTLILLVHVPALFLFGYLVGGFEVTPLATEVAFPLVAAILGAVPMVRRRIRMFAVTTGLIYSSVALLHLSGGAAEAALHFLVVVVVVFLYREWFLFLWAIVLMGSSYQLLEVTQGVLGDVGVEPAAPEMALWALMAAGGIASVSMIVAWRTAQDSRQATVAALQSARERDDVAARRDAYGKMYVNLARRSQSLVDRQLTVIDQLEEDVQDPDVLAAVFELDHLTTRIRRHGESLLVVADVDLPARADEPVPLTDILRGAQSEIEQYRRVDARIEASITIEASAARDLVHLLAELLDNATTYSPPSSTVQVHARGGDAGAVVLTIEDHGLGLTPDRLVEANRDLQDPDALDENAVRHLGFHVIARLSQKHGVTVRLTSTNGGGVTAWVELPAAVVAASDHSSLAPTRLPDTPVEPEPWVEPVAQEEAAPAPSNSPVPATPAPATAEHPPPPPPPAAPEPGSPAAVSAGFSANGAHGRGRRGWSPLGTSHQRSALPPSASEPPSATVPSPPPAPAPPLPQRQRGASASEAAPAPEEEVVDLFAAFDHGEERSSLGDFQRGQESARREARG